MPISARGTLERGLLGREVIFLDKMTGKETPGNSGMLAARLDVTGEGGASGAKDELGREAQAGGSSACLSTVCQYHLQGWMTSRAAATAAPASGETQGWGWR